MKSRQRSSRFDVSIPMRLLKKKFVKRLSLVETVNLFRNCVCHFESARPLRPTDRIKICDIEKPLDFHRNSGNRINAYLFTLIFVWGSTINLLKPLPVMTTTIMTSHFLTTLEYEWFWFFFAPNRQSQITASVSLFFCKEVNLIRSICEPCSLVV